MLALVGHWREEELDNHIRRTALLCGYFAYHTRWSVKSESGFPDWVLLKPPRLLVVEAKRQGLWPTLPKPGRGGRWRIGQTEWLARWARLPQAEVFVWWPSDSLGDIARILQAGATPEMACVRRIRAILAAEEVGDGYAPPLPPAEALPPVLPGGGAD